MTPPLTCRVLHIGQDDLFANLRGVESKFIATGHSITPGAPGRGALSVGSLMQLLTTMTSTARYDVIALPVVRFDWPHDRSQLKRGLRRVAGGLTRQRWFKYCINRWLRRRSECVIALDRFDKCKVDHSFLEAVDCLSAYYKTNLEVGAEASCPLRFLPYWIATEHYPDPGPVEKDIDVLFLGALNSEQRVQGKRVLEEMRGSGYRVMAPEVRVSFEEYQQLTARSWLTLSPQGLGYNGFRHYEAMLLHSVPVINHHQSEVMHDFVDGENCFLYEPHQLRARLETALVDKHRLRAMSRGLRAFALEHHSFSGVGQFVLDSLHLTTFQSFAAQ